MGTEVGRIVRRFRLRSKLSQADLGKRLGVSNVFVSYIESGERHLPSRYLVKTAKLLGIDEERIKRAYSRDIITGVRELT